MEKLQAPLQAGRMTWSDRLSTIKPKTYNSEYRNRNRRVKDSKSLTISNLSVPSWACIGRFASELERIEHGGHNPRIAKEIPGH